MGAASGIGSLFGGMSAAKQAKAQLRALDDKEKKVQDWYNQESNTNILDTSSSKAALSQLRKQNDATLKKVSNNAIRRGYTEEAKVAMASAANDNYADALVSHSAKDDERKSNLRSSYKNELNRIDEMRGQINAAKASAMSSLVDNIGSTANSIVSLGSDFAKKRKEKKSNSLI